MDPYSARRHALYQPRGLLESEIDYPTASDPQQGLQIDELDASWYGSALGIDVPEVTPESLDATTSFLPATQPAKRIRVEADEISIPIDIRTEVFALLSGASLDEFLEIRHFLKRQNYASPFTNNTNDVSVGPSANYSMEDPASTYVSANSRSISMPPQPNHWPDKRYPSQIGMDSSIFGSRHESMPSHVGQLGGATPLPNLSQPNLNYLSDDSAPLSMDFMARNTPARPSLTSNAVPFLDVPAGTGPSRDFSRRRAIYWAGAVDSNRDSTMSRSSTSSVYTDRSLTSKHSSTSTVASQSGRFSGMPMPRSTLSSAAIQSMAQFVDLYPPSSARGASAQSTPQIPCDFPPCTETFGRKADRDRHHSQFHVPEILYTCLLDTCTSECEDPCTEKFHNSPCRKTRPDKMKRHLASSHGIDIKQSEIPESWRRFYVHSPNGWSCGFCNEFLGTWSDNEDAISGHFESCRLPETQSTSEVHEQSDSTKESDVGNELNNSLKRLSVQEKPDPDGKKHL